MHKDSINGQAIDVAIIAADGTEVADTLKADEKELLAKIDKTLKADPRFQTACPDARLARIDSNRGLADRDEGRFYLRYQHQRGTVEFWGNVADAQKVDMEQGMVAVAG